MIIKEQPARQFPAFCVRYIVRLAVAAIALTLLLGIAAPYVNADAYRDRIQAALEETLGRRVEIKKIRFTLFTGPGFTLEQVTIKEDPRYGLEPFAYVPTLEVRVRLDKLLLGQTRLLGLRMVDASLNLVKSDDGTWNAVALVERLGAPRRTPLNFFPAVQISNGRVDFKLGTRKSTFYLMETDVSVYPESSGKIYFKFEGSPARTDRAGNGFGHLTGTANWYLQPAAVSGNQLEADVNLQPSNLSELATLLQGQDLGVHGNVSAHVLISGPFSNLRALGDMRLDNVHRWDLLPSPGDSWRVPFSALIDLEEHTLELATLPLSASENPLMLQFKTSELMTHPSWSVLATMRKAPLASLLPLGRRMGIALPAGLQMDGSLDGVVGYTNSAGLQGGVVISNVVANVPQVPPLHSASANITISGKNIHIDPAILQLDRGGTLSAGGDFNMETQDMAADINAEAFSVEAFKQTTGAWFGAPHALAIVEAGNVSGHFRVSYPASSIQPDPPHLPIWSGQAQISDATLNIPGAAVPVTNFHARVTFDEDTLDIPMMSGLLAELPFKGSYRYSVAAKHPERLRLEFASANLSALETDLAPTLSDNGLLSRLTFARRSIPPWLAYRNMEGEVAIAKCSLNQAELGSLSTHFVWQGTLFQVTDLKLGLPIGKLKASGTIALSARLPRYHFAVDVAGLSWNGGSVNLTGIFDTSGLGLVALERVEASGQLSARALVFSGSDPVDIASSQFTLVSNGTAPILKLTEVDAQQGGEDWSGGALSGADGKLHLDLTNGDRQLHLLSELTSAGGVP